MTTITNRILIFKPMIKKPIVTNLTYDILIDILVTFLLSLLSARSMLSLTSIQFSTTFIGSNLYLSQKDCHHQDNLSFGCLQLYKLNCQNILGSNISHNKQVMNQYK